MKKEGFYWFNEHDFLLYGPFASLKEAKEGVDLHDNHHGSEAIVVKVVARSVQPDTIHPPREWKPA